MLQYDEAKIIILNEASAVIPKIESLPLLKSLHRVLAEDVYSDSDLPCFTNSSMDGFAIKYSQRKSWTIIDEIPAGHFHTVALNDDKAVRIMTGGKLPEDADTVIPLEDLTEITNSISLLDTAKVKPGQFVRHVGEDLLKNRMAVEKNTYLESRHIALLAMCGKDMVNVYAPLKAGVLTTGDELIDINDAPKDDKVRASNLYTILAALQNLNLDTINLGILRDDKPVIKQAVHSALNSDIDILITTGGVSVGKYDFLKEVFSELGVDIVFNKVNIKPGKPVVFGKYTNGTAVKYIFGLPGNPVSSYATFKILVEPFIHGIYRQSETAPVQAILKTDYKKSDKRRHFVRGLLSYNGDAFTVAVQGLQSSNNLAGLAQSNCLFIADEEVEIIKAGTGVSCIRI
jgi:molybdopterin molybdotransferase